jgi:hypothetical protein
MLLLWSVVASLAFPRKLLDNVAGKSILLFFTAFYMVRIFGEFAYFGFHMPQSLFIIALCLVPMIGFGLVPGAHTIPLHRQLWGHLQRP